MIGRHVVDPRDELRERHVLQTREQLLDRGTDRRAPAGLYPRPRPPRGEIAREDSAVGELLRRECELRRDDERLEQPLADRVAEKQVAILGDQREVDPERRQQRARVGAGRDDDDVGFDALDAPAARCGRDRPHADAPNVDAGRERLHHRLGPIEVTVVGTPGGARQLIDAQPRNQLRCVGG